MENIVVKQIFDDIDETNLRTMTKWMYDWWGKEDNLSMEEVECFMIHSLQKERLPQTYGLFLDERIIGMYQFSYEDLSVRPDIYPWLANVYIDKKYRNKGCAKYMLETVKENAKKGINFNELFLYTEHINFYEKFGWEYISDFDTFRKKPRIQKLYKLSLTN